MVALSLLVELFPVSLNQDAHLVKLVNTTDLKSVLFLELSVQVR